MTPYNKGKRRMSIYGAKGRLARPEKKKALLSGSGSFKTRAVPQRGWFGRILDALRNLLGGGQTRRYLKANKALQKQTKANLQRSDRLRKMSRVKERRL